MHIMKSDIIIIGGGAAGLMAAYGAAKTLIDNGSSAQVTILEKMPRPARKVMITGKGRCNFTNVKPWNEFVAHIRSRPNLIRPAFQNLTPEALVQFMNKHGLETVVERGDRAFPISHHASDVVDTLVRATEGLGVKIICSCEVHDICRKDDKYQIKCNNDEIFICSKVIIATGGLSYPVTGSTGDGYRWAEAFGHSIEPLFPSLTALVPKGYKSEPYKSEFKGHIDRSTALTDWGRSLCGIQLKNIGLTTIINGCEAENLFGDIDFTDGGLEGPLGFQASRKCVKSIINGAKVTLRLDLKHGVEEQEVKERVKQLWDDIARDPRSRDTRDKERCRILLGKLMPWELIPAFIAAHPDIIKTTRLAGTRERSGKYSVGASKTFIDLSLIAQSLKKWDFELAGFVGYERCVVTAGGINTDELIAKTLESRLSEGLYFCGEVIDTDSDTGGYNLHTAFCTGFLAGQSAARKLLIS